MDKIANIRAQRSAAYEALQAIAVLDSLSADQEKQFDALASQVRAFDADISRKIEVQELSRKSAQPVSGQAGASVPAQVKADPYEKDSTLVIAGCAKMLAVGKNLRDARTESAVIYGEEHPVTKALGVSSGPSGGFIVPPEYSSDFIDLLRNKAVVRQAGPLAIPMPNGTMTMPGQASAATATYIGENLPAPTSQQTFNNINASAKKLTALVPVSNQLMRFASPAADAIVRNDLLKVIALREDLAFLLGDGTQETPRGMLSFANGFASANGGTAGTFSSTVASTAAVGGQFITSTAAFTLATVSAELGGLISKLDTQNVPDEKRVWFMSPRTWNYLFSVLNSLGVYVYRDELATGKLLGYPVMKSNQIPANIITPGSAQNNASFILLTEMTEAMIFDAMTLELMVSMEGSYTDGNGNTISAFQNDQTLIRAIEQHDFHMRHDASVAVDQFVLWAPSIS